MSASRERFKKCQPHDKVAVTLPYPHNMIPVGRRNPRQIGSFDLRLHGILPISPSISLPHSHAAGLYYMDLVMFRLLVSPDASPSVTNYENHEFTAINTNVRLLRIEATRI